ncbi:response regulator transcription factor [Lapillicoccus jejuensis]|uniref:LuxR family two component transcriptional regulator n=1 Tax=Lapillicoccus jejuensis TaxID=402171 RepID=A0A542E5S5_9MICO|nr:response regulator transcription factor [Lapillicoccus jejuensis]TQJ10681.1 LuxR family two component transcriptional regulator [Lapillicoccus jejuensis]
MDELARPARGATRVLVVDDHRMMADAIALAVAGQPDLECVGIAVDLASALDEVERSAPDVVVMDLRLGRDDGLEATTRVLAQRPGLRVVVLTAYVNAGLLLRVADAGGVALLPKDGVLDDLLTAIRTAGPGRFFAPAELLRTMARAASDVEDTRRMLTPRELDVLALLARGYDATTAARALGISVQTCRSYIKSILAKLQTHTQLEAVVAALRLGLVHLDA